MNRILFVILAALPCFSLTMDEVRNATANQWIPVPNSRMDAVNPCPAGNCVYSGVEGISGMMDDWCGGAFDTRRNRLVIWGGGHNGYYGNELYAFDVNTMAWSRLTEPSTQLTFNQDPMANGMPVSRHTYGGLAYLSHADRFFGLGGSVANNGFASTNIVWVFDFDSKQWANKGGCGHGVGHGSTCAYDPVSRKLYWGEGNNSDYNAWGLHSYDYDSNRWTKLDDARPYNSTSGAYDTKRGLLFFVGAGHVWVYDIKNSNFAAQDWTTTGGGTLVSSTSPGLDYDPAADRIAGWNGGAVYALNPDTRAWTSYNPSGAPAKNMNNTYGRWRYVPSVNAFISANQTSSNVYFFKLTSGGSTAPEQRLPRPMAMDRVCFQADAIYDISGRRVTAPRQSGVYLHVTGKKIEKRLYLK